MINIEELVVEIIDPSIGAAVISEKEHPEDSGAYDYIEGHIEKSFHDIANKELSRIGNSELLKLIDDYRAGSLEFLDLSETLADQIYQLYAASDQKGFDLVIAKYNYENRDYLGLYFFHYRESYIHTIDYLDGKKVNKIIKQKTSLASEKQKLDEFIIFDLEADKILLKEKRYDLDGQKDFILSTYLLKVDKPLSPKDKIDIVNRTNKKIVKDFYNDDVNKLAEINSHMLKTVEEAGEIDINKLAEESFKNNFEIQAAYNEEVEKKGIYEKNIEVTSGLAKRLPSIQKIVLDDGIEIKIPIAVLKDKSKLEFVTDESGGVSIIIKNLHEIKNK